VAEEGTVCGEEDFEAELICGRRTRDGNFVRIHGIEGVLEEWRGGEVHHVPDVLDAHGVISARMTE
jgi:hypothetical protein